eukprot:6474055-Amphidinium_carterae.2
MQLTNKNGNKIVQDTNCKQSFTCTSQLNPDKEDASPCKRKVLETSRPECEKNGIENRPVLTIMPLLSNKGKTSEAVNTGITPKVPPNNKNQ